MTYPYDDDNMKFVDGMYYLTEKALLSMGVDLRARLAARKAISPEMLIQQLMSIVSTNIYGYIHDFSLNTELQDKIIAEMPSARKIIYEALKLQALHVLRVGDLYSSTDPKIREAAIYEGAKNVLNKKIIEIGCPITYVGA